MNQTHHRRSVFLTVGLIVGAILLVPATTFADTGNTNTIKVLPATTTISPVGTGSSFTVQVVANGSVDISGAAVGLAFDNTKLTLTDIAKDATIVANGGGYGGFPSNANKPAFIANANSAGQIPNIGYFYTDGSTFDLANTDVTFYTATFSVAAVGDSVLTPNQGPGILDGRAASYGTPLTIDAIVNGNVVNSAAATPTPAPTATPTAVPSATPSATPTATPTPVPTATPTPAPTATPTAVPSATPSATPTATPTPVPTATPTPAPTATPTTVPSATPSATPTATPTPAPTATPTAVPSAAPTPAPSSTPTGSVEGATGTPGVTLPPTDATPTDGPGSSATGAILGLAGLTMIGAAALIVANSRRGRARFGRRI